MCFTYLSGCYWDSYFFKCKLLGNLVSVQDRSCHCTLRAICFFSHFPIFFLLPSLLAGHSLHFMVTPKGFLFIDSFRPFFPRNGHCVCSSTWVTWRQRSHLVPASHVGVSKSPSDPCGDLLCKCNACWHWWGLWTGIVGSSGLYFS